MGTGERLYESALPSSTFPHSMDLSPEAIGSGVLLYNFLCFPLILASMMMAEKRWRGKEMASQTVSIWRWHTPALVSGNMIMLMPYRTRRNMIMPSFPAFNRHRAVDWRGSWLQ
ncbi:hypothetical protein CRG98_050280 [Punica granatum]|uniref:Uncharacterized protein n=1 Tax=Punica granatum TaxID=22663 RepID=A0A2I0GJY1_PUNGR|nr:hypothetical protein CRG98_050280 [Punica granatum]